MSSPPPKLPINNRATTVARLLRRKMKLSLIPEVAEQDKAALVPTDDEEEKTSPEKKQEEKKVDKSTDIGEDGPRRSSRLAAKKE